MSKLSTLDVNGRSGDGSGSVGLQFLDGKAPTTINLPGCQTLSVLSQARTRIENTGPRATTFTAQASFSLACFTYRLSQLVVDRLTHAFR